MNVPALIPINAARPLLASDATLRDYFAAAALPAIIEMHYRQLKEDGQDLDLQAEHGEAATFDNTYACETAYQVADQMLEERK